jgi:hypothetical protein
MEELKWIVALAILWLTTLWIAWKIGHDTGYEKGEEDYKMDSEERGEFYDAEAKLVAIRKVLSEEKKAEEKK